MVPYAAHSALEPAGIQATRILHLFDAYLDVSVVVFTLVIAALGFALGRKAEPGTERRELEPEARRSKRRVVAWATAATVVTLVGLLVASVATGHALSILPSANAVHVQVIAHEWWWEFRYPVSGPATQFSTA